MAEVVGEARSMGSASPAPSPARDVYDAVVVGSGFGGAVAACRLAQAGRSVAVLERGRRWEGDDFPRSIGQVAEAFWDEGRSHGFVEYLAFRKLDVVQGAGVGGGSLHYFNVNVRTPARVFEDPAWPLAVRRRMLDPYYDVALDMLESGPLRPPVGRDHLPARTDVFVGAARRAGLPVQEADIAVYTGEARTHPISGIAQSPCTYCGNCLFGCAVGSKNTLDLNYLALAERHGAQVLPLHVVDTIAHDPGGGYEVRFHRLSPDRPGAAPVAGRLTASQVVVAAGSLGSTRLLLASRDVARTVPALGRRFSLNGEFLFASARDTTERTDPGLGPPITAMVTVERKGHLVTVEDLGLPDAMLWFLEGAFPPRGGRLRGMLAVAGAYLKRSLGLGGRTSRLALQMDALLAGGRTPHSIPYLGMGTDTSDGTMRLVDGALDIDWSPVRNRRMYREIERLMGEISRAAGGSFSTSFLWRWPLRKALTAHPLGGCPMGDDPATSVTNHRGEVWGHPGLYVVDGAIIPSALAVNPSLTIAALAERAAFFMVHDREMTVGDARAPANR
jgi:cholesterol oxidase